MISPLCATVNLRSILEINIQRHQLLLQLHKFSRAVIFLESEKPFF